MSCDCLRQWCRKNRIILRNNELKRERKEEKKRKEYVRIREKEIEARGKRI